jgi:aminoglycoside phosphotransferase (APT) family kinase protein
MMLDPLPTLADFGPPLQACFPALGPITPRRVLGAGFRSVAIATAEGQDFRLARNAAAAAGYAKERRLLPALRPHLPLPIPDPQWVAGPSAAFPFGVIGYPLLPGRPLTPADLARGHRARLAADLAAFLRALHRVPLAEVAALGLPGPADRAARWEAMRATTLPMLRDRLSADEYVLVARWWDRLLADPRLGDYQPVLHHGDLWYENLLVDEGATRLTGVVDFEDAALGDPAQDFATLLHLDESFAAQVSVAYAAAGGALDATFAYRRQRLWELREFEGLAFAIRTADADEIADALAKLRRGPILRARPPR